MALTQAQFLLYSGYSASDVNLNFLQWTLDNIDEKIQEECGTLFQLIPVNSSNTDFPYIDYRGANMSYVSIDAWQPNDLVVQIGSYGSSSPALQTLTETRDYTLERPKNKVIPLASSNNPVVGIRLIKNILSNTSSFYNGSRDQFYRGGTFSDKLYSDQFLRITGVWGWSNGYPTDLENLLYQTVKSNLEYNKNMTDTGGKGYATKEQSLTLDKEFSNSQTTAQDAKKLAFNIMSDPTVKELINEYKQNTFKQVRVS